MPVPRQSRRRRIFGLEIERNIDILALLGFLIAAVTAGYNIVGALRGHETILFPPEQILILAAPYPDTVQEYVRINARMAYVNTGQPGYNSVVAIERVEFSIGSDGFEQVGLTYESFRIKDGKLVSASFSDAKPIAVNAGSTESHETFFGPQAVSCKADKPDCNRNMNFLTWEKFIRLIDIAKLIWFTFRASLHDDRDLIQMCTVTVDNATFTNLVARQFDSVLCTKNAKKNDSKQVSSRKILTYGLDFGRLSRIAVTALLSPCRTHLRFSFSPTKGAGCAGGRVAYLEHLFNAPCPFAARCGS